MKIAHIKNLYEKTPYFIKRPFAGGIRNQLIHNPVFVSAYSELERFDRLSEEEKKQRQLRELKELLVYAYRKSEFYRTRFDEYGFDPTKLSDIGELQLLPILEKSTLQQCLNEINVDEIRNAYPVTTGGTTGEPTKVWMEKDAVYREWAFVYHYWAKYGYDYNSSRLAAFRGVDLGGKISEINPLYAEIRLNPFLLNEENIRQYIKRIDDYGADFIYGYPSAIYQFCRIARAQKIELKNRFKAALLVSENLYDYQERLITEVLHCEIAMFYGHSERAVFGERTGQAYVFHPLYGVVEVGPEGEPIVTGFINRKTPLIRYKVDDELQPIDSEHFLIHGHRDSDVLVGRKGSRFRGTMLNYHGLLSEKIGAYQFVQNEVGRCELHIADGKAKEEDIEKVITSLENRCGNLLSFEVVRVAGLQYSSRGKYRIVIQNLDV